MPRQTIAQSQARACQSSLPRKNYPAGSPAGWSAAATEESSATGGAASRRPPFREFASGRASAGRFAADWAGNLAVFRTGAAVPFKSAPQRGHHGGRFSPGWIATIYAHLLHPIIGLPPAQA